MLDTRTIVVSRHVEIWDGVMHSQLRQTEFDKSLPSGPITTEGERDGGIPVIVTFKKNGQRNMREFDTGMEENTEKREVKEDVKDHGGRLLRAKMIPYEYKDGYYVIKKAGELRKRERDKWNIITENEYKDIVDDAKEQVRNSLKEALKTKKPHIDSLFEDVYETVPHHLKEQNKQLRAHLEKYPEVYNLEQYVENK